MVDNIDFIDSINNFNQKYSYQSLKKLLAYSIIKDDYVVLDSENLCLKEFYFKDMWKLMKTNKIYYTTTLFDDLSIRVLNESNKLIDADYPYWFFITSYWFFEYNHVCSLINLLKLNGPILYLLKDVYFFEYQLYCSFLYKHQLKVFENVFTIANKEYNFEDHLNRTNWQWAYICTAINNENVLAYCNFLEVTNERITRLHWMPTDIKDIILSNTQVCIGTFHWD